MNIKSPVIMKFMIYVYILCKSLVSRSLFPLYCLSLLDTYCKLMINEHYRFLPMDGSVNNVTRQTTCGLTSLMERFSVVEGS